MEILEELWLEYGSVIVGIVFLGTLLGVMLYNDPDRVRQRNRRWRGKLMEDQRKTYLLSRVADYITDGADEDLWKDRISVAERNQIFRDCARKLNIRDLAPRNGVMSMELLKKMIKHRVNSDKYYRDKNDKRINVVVFPDCPEWTMKPYTFNPQ